jgi:hypothetical protein
MTLPEVLVAITVLGIIIAVLSSTLIVTMTQQSSSEGRLNVARAEQNVGLWMPADLSSADVANTDPWASPCGATVCNGIDLSKGSNVLMLTWEINGVTTSVSYHFRPTAGTTTYELLRVECVGGVCTSMVLLDELPGPPAGQVFVPGVGKGAAECQARDNLPVADPSRPTCTRPSWVITVSAPLAADATSTDDEVSAGDTKDANRVVVTINGGGAGPGGGGGVNQISITAGGTTRHQIDANSLLGAPSLVATRSKCGGPVTLIIDESTSIGSSNMINNVRPAVSGFIDALIGTPVKIQIITFDTKSANLAPGNPWRRYFDMTNPTDVSTLQGLVSGLTSSGDTNWEDALYRTFFDPETGGNPPKIAQELPTKVVFFTDGFPTVDRTDPDWRAAPSTADPLPNSPMYGGAQWGDYAAAKFHNVSFNRALYIADMFRGQTTFIAVGVGSFTPSDIVTTFVTPDRVGSPLAYQQRAVWTYQRRPTFDWETNLDFESAPLTSTVNFQVANVFQSNLDFEKATTFQSKDFQKATTFQSNIDFEKAATFQSNQNYQNKVDFETKSGSTWSNATLAQYVAATAANRRIQTETRPWTNVSPTEYNTYRTQFGTAAQWAVNGTRTAYTATEAEFDIFNTTAADFTDGWQILTWGDATDVVYYASQPAAPAKYRINAGTRTAYTVTEAAYDARNTTPADFTDGWQISAWSTTDPATYYATAAAKRRINGSGWVNRVETLWDSYRAGSPSDWQVSAWTNTDPTTYYTNQPGSPAKYQIGTATTWVAITEAQYNAYNTTTDATDHFQIPSTTTYANVTPTVYDTAVRPTNSLSHKYKINGTRTAYSVTSAEYSTLRGLYGTASNWVIGTWADVSNPTTYYTSNLTADENDGWRIRVPSNRNSGNWYNITSAEYDTYNTTGDTTDGFRKTTPSGSTWNTTTEDDFVMHDLIAGTSDGYQKVPTTTSAWVDAGGAEYLFYSAGGTTAEKSGYRTNPITDGSSPDAYTDPTYLTSSTNPKAPRSSAILVNLVTGSPPKADGSPGGATLSDVGGVYDMAQAKLATTFLPNNWSALPAALKAVALGDCGGTLTVQTKVVGAAAAPDPFTYQNTWVQLAGSPKELSQQVVTTNLGQVASTFDFKIDSGMYIDAGVELQNFDELDMYAFDRWECRAGPTPRNAAPNFAVAGGSAAWPGITIRVAANEAVSCIQWVKKVG